jgi:hypothetical protein
MTVASPAREFAPVTGDQHKLLILREKFKNQNLDFVPRYLDFVPSGLDFVPSNLDFVPADLGFLHAPPRRRGLPPSMEKGGPQAALAAPLEGRMLQAE